MCIEKLKDMWEEYKEVFYVLSWVFISLVLFGLVTYLIFHCLHWWGLPSLFSNANTPDNSVDHSVIEIYSVSLIILTIGLVGVIWLQLKNANKALEKADKNLRGEFLLKVDERFASSETEKAAKIIKVLCCKYKVENVQDDSNLEMVSNEIKDMAKNVMSSKQEETESKAEDIVCLLSFLDFLETIAYFANQKLVSKEDINETLGGTLCFYHKIFIGLIGYQRGYLCRKDEYCQLEKMAKEISDACSAK